MNVLDSMDSKIKKSWFLLIDKPKGITSFDLIAIIRKKFLIKRVWHSWTLDPLATWLMLVWVWEACKFLKWHTHDKKSYQAEITLWKISETYDGQWPIVEVNYKWEISKQKMLETLEWFKWKIVQTPPKYSAIKVEWRKLCDITRKWETVNIPKREVEISILTLLSFNYPILKLDITCSSWTYIRSIASDIWKRLWCWAYLSGLLRTKIENYNLKNAIQVGEISFEKLKSIDFWLEHIEKLELEEKIIKRLVIWQRININDIPETLKIKNWKLKIENSYRLYSNWNFHWIWKISTNKETWSKLLIWEKIINN